MACLEYKATQQEDKLIPGKPQETVGADIFMMNNKT